MDTKYGLQEVYGNLIGKEHDRERREMLRAQENGQKLVYLVEEAGIDDLEHVKEWKNPRGAHHKAGHKPPITSEQLQKVMETMAEEYGCSWEFCEKESTGRRIIEILLKKNDISGE